MTQQHDETFLALQDEIAKLYHQGPKPQPSAQLDEAILAQAQTELSLSQSAALALAVQNQDETNVVSIKGWRQYRWQLSSAASVVLVAGLFMMMPMEQHYHSLGLNLSDLNSSEFESLSSGTAAGDKESDILPMASKSMASAPMAALKADSLPSDDVPTSPQESSLSAHSTPRIIDTNNLDTQAIAEGGPQTRLSKQADETDKMASQVEQSRQQKMISTLTPSTRNELTLEANEHYSKDSGIISLDTADKAMVKLTELMKSNQFTEAERYMLTMEQRFPELNNLTHPLHEDYNKIKQQLTVK